MKYTVKGKVQNVRQPDGSTVERCEPDVHFHTAAGLLRWALNGNKPKSERRPSDPERPVLAHRVGGRPRPVRFDEPHFGRYGSGDSFSEYVLYPEHFAAMRRAQSRYNEIIHYLREVEPEWRPNVTEYTNDKGEVYYADNSVERREIDKYGRTRTVMVKPPSGDACF